MDKMNLTNQARYLNAIQSFAPKNCTLREVVNRVVEMYPGWCVWRDCIDHIREEHIPAEVMHYFSVNNHRRVTVHRSDNLTRFTYIPSY